MNVIIRVMTVSGASDDQIVAVVTF